MQNRQIGEPKINGATDWAQHWSQKLIAGGFYTVVDADSGYARPGAWCEIVFFLSGSVFRLFAPFCYLCQVERFNRLGALYV